MATLWLEGTIRLLQEMSLSTYHVPPIITDGGNSTVSEIVVIQWSLYTLKSTF